MNPVEIFRTGGGQPVRTVYVTGVRADENKETLKTFFMGNVGAVSKVRIHTAVRPLNKKQFGFVEFVDPNHAARAILEKKYFINGHFIYVRKADDWHQPIDSATNESAITTVEEDDLTTITNTPLIRLNDDCLLEIYKYLSLVDKINLSLSFARLTNFAQTYVYPKYSTFGFENEFGCSHYYESENVNEYEKILRHIGPFINNLTISSVYQEKKDRHILQLVLAHCNSLDSLRLEKFTESIENFYATPNLLTTIKSLELIDCSQLTDKFVRFIKFCPELERILICGNTGINGTLLQITNNLTELHLISVYGMQNGPLNKTFQSNKKLSNLTINNCTNLTATIYPDLVKHLPQLQHLSIDLKYVNGPNQLNCLANLEHLQHLQIHCNLYNISTYLNKLGDRNRLEEFEINNGLLEAETLDTLFKFNRLKRLKISNPFSEHENMLAVISKHLPQLEEFHCSGCHSITADTLIEYVKMTPQLQRLIATNCNGINDSLLVGGLIEMLKKLNIDGNNEKRSVLKLILDSDLFEPETTTLLEKNTNLVIVSAYKPISDDYQNDLDNHFEGFDYEDFDYFDPEDLDSDYYDDEDDEDFISDSDLEDIEFLNF